MEIPKEKLLEMYRNLITARRVDEKLYEIFTADGRSMHRATGKLDLNGLAPRIKELKRRQDELLKARVLLEADMTVQGVQHVDAEQVKSYACDLRSLLTETDITKSKAFLRSFVEKYFTLLAGVV